MSTSDHYPASTTTTVTWPPTTDTLTYYYPYYSWPVQLTEDDVRRVLREELEDILVNDKALKKATVAALKKRLRELESD